MQPVQADLAEILDRLPSKLPWTAWWAKSFDGARRGHHQHPNRGDETCVQISVAVCRSSPDATRRVSGCLERGSQLLVEGCPQRNSAYPQVVEPETELLVDDVSKDVEEAETGRFCRRLNAAWRHSFWLPGRSSLDAAARIAASSL